jgi:hypothetical protein
LLLIPMPAITDIHNSKYATIPAERDIYQYTRESSAALAPSTWLMCVSVLVIAVDAPCSWPLSATADKNPNAIADPAITASFVVLVRAGAGREIELDMGEFLVFNQ